MILLISLIIIILAHEAGHFIAAKLCKCGVEEYAFGFGPAILKKKIGKTVYRINYFPFGGYVRLKDELRFSKSPYAFTNQTYREKLFISLAGIIVNVVMGAIAWYAGLYYQSVPLCAFGFYSFWIGISNLAPIPCLDGFYPIIFALEKKYGKKKTYEYWAKIVQFFFVILMVLNFISIPFFIWLFIEGRIL